MKKALIGMGIMWFFLILVGVTMSSVDDRNTAACEKPETLLTVHKFNGTTAQKSLGIHFPVR
jgi:glucose uptake protein GlcU